jgi:6-phosphogluconolactonase
MRSIPTPVGWLALGAMACGGLSAADSATIDPLLYVGTYTAPQKSAGIYLFRLRSADLSLIPLGLAAATPSPSFLAIDPQRRFLFAVNETGTFAGQPTGSVSAFALDPVTGKLALLNQRSSLGSGPCHLTVDRTGRHVLVANYNSGSVAVLPVASDGRLGEPTAFVQHAGNSIDPGRQAGPHAHCVTLDAANRFAFVCDLGLDQVRAYRYDPERGTLAPAETPFTSIKPGSGPRHLVFRPDGRFAYVINELNSTVTSFAYDADQGRLRELATVSTLPAGFDGKSAGAEIAVEPSGRWLYTSNRGHDSVVRFAIDPEAGTLSHLADNSSGGKTPRHFGLSPSGRELVIANQNSDNLIVASLDPATGRFMRSGAVAQAFSPVCTVFLPDPAPPR